MDRMIQAMGSKRIEIVENLEKRTLKQGSLGPAMIAFFVISAAGPLVAMAGGIPIAMLFGNGPGLPAMFLVATIILIVFSAGYTAMAGEVRNAGAFYAFAARGLGGVAGGATGLVALLAYNGIQIGLYGLFGSAANALFQPVLGFSLPWWFYAFGAMGMVAFFGYRQVDLSAKILGALVAGEYLVVLVLDIAIVAVGGDQGLSASPFSPSIAMMGSPAIGLMLCFSAFVGFEATTIYSEEARHPERTIPLATYASVLLIGGFYTVSTWVVVNGVGIGRLMPLLHGYADPTALLFDLGGRYVGPWLPVVMRILFVTSTFAGLLAFHNAIARYLYAMGREGLFPTALGQTHPRTQSPHIGSLVQTVIAALCIGIFALSGADPVLIVFTLCSAIATLGILVLMGVTSLATLSYFARRPAGRRLVMLFSGIALVAFVGIAGLAAIRFDILAGLSSPLIMALPLLVPAAAIIGCGLALRLRKTSVERYAQLGQTMV